MLILVGRPRSTGLLLSGRNLRKVVKLATWNVTTLLDRNEAQRMQRRSAVVAKELEKIGVDVAALQETRLEGSGMIKEKEFSIFWSGVEAGERRQAGVSLAVRNDVLKKMNSLPKAISDRIIVMRVLLSNNKFATIISTYAPTMTYPEPSLDLGLLFLFIYF